MSAISQFGFDPNSSASNNVNRLGGNGWIPSNAAGRLNNSASQSFIGNVRNPATLGQSAAVVTIRR